MANTEKQSTVTIEVNGKAHRFTVWPGIRLAQFIDMNGYQSKETYLAAINAFAKDIASNPVHSIGKERTVFSKDGSFDRVQSVSYTVGKATREQAERYVQDSKARSEKQIAKLVNGLARMDDLTAKTPVNA